MAFLDLDLELLIELNLNPETLLSTVFLRQICIHTVLKKKSWGNLCVKKVVEAVLEEEVEEKVECVGGGQGGVHTRQLGRQQRRHQLRHSQSADKI